GDYRFDDQCLQHLLVHIGEFLDVEAALAGSVLAEPSEQRLSVAEPCQAIENGRGLTRRKTGKRHIALLPALVGVVMAAKADYRWPPHSRLFTGRTLHQLDERLGVRTLGLVRERVDIRRDTEFRG